MSELVRVLRNGSLIGVPREDIDYAVDRVTLAGILLVHPSIKQGHFLVSQDPFFSGCLDLYSVLVRHGESPFDSARRCLDGLGISSKFALLNSNGIEYHKGAQQFRGSITSFYCSPSRKELPVAVSVSRSLVEEFPDCCSPALRIAYAMYKAHGF